MSVSDPEPVDEGSEPGRITVLIAVEESEAPSNDTGVNTVRTAHRLFGDAARYLVVNVGNDQYLALQPSYVYPVMTPAVWYPPMRSVDGVEDRPAEVGHATQTAEQIAADAALDDATPLGDVGDPATAIIRAAHDHKVDVVVIGSHERGWFSRLLTGSVERDLLREADFAVLVVK